MASKKQKRDQPEETRQNDRDERGLFLPGNSVGAKGGRPRGVDFRRLIVEFRQAALDGDLQNVYDAMLQRALSGDVQAAKLILDRLCDNDAIKIEHSGDMMPKMTPQEVAKEILRIEKALADDSKS